MPAQAVFPVDITVGGPRGVRAFVVTGDRPFLIDTGIPGSAPAILAELERLSISPTDIALIVITHAHPDHAGSAAELQAITGAPILAQRTDAAALAVGASEPVVGRTPTARAFAEQIAARMGDAPSGPAYAPVTAGSVVDDAADLSEFGLDARVIHTPGHTDGGLTVILGSDEAIVGDLIGSVEGKPALAGFATDETAMVDSVRRVLALEPSMVHTCHDGSFELAVVLEAFNYLA
jgi:glyoxylase-like metal-dependent hydrolase (beta-lactamase superfamily II)